MKRSYGYDSYRGRSGLRTFLKVLAWLLAVVLVVLIAGFFLLRQYIVYTDTGPKLVLPGWAETDRQDPAVQSPTPTPTPSQVLVVEDDPEPTPTPTPEPKAYTGYVTLPVTALTDGTALDQVTQAGADGAIFDMKREDGYLGYQSAVPAAVEGRTSGEIVVESVPEELYAVARLSCFRDNRMPRQHNPWALRTATGNWVDSESIRWLSPANQWAVDYVAAVCAELAAMGFDELLLDYASFPTQGRTANIQISDNYDPDDLEGALDRFYAAVEETIAPYGVTLSIVTTEEALITGAGGQTAGLLGRYADRLYVAGPQATGVGVIGLLTQAGVSMDPADVVTITDTPLEGASLSWAVLP